MKIRITKIADPGVVSKERLVLKVAIADDIGRYVVFDTIEVEPDSISSRPRNVYWFPDGEVKVGDQIVLYTKKGVNTQRKNEDGSTTFFFYWGKEKTLWNKKGDGAVLLRIEGFDYKFRI